MSVSNRYADIGRVQADARRQRGSRLGDLVAGLSQVPAQIFARQEQEQLKQQKEAHLVRAEEREVRADERAVKEFELHQQEVSAKLGAIKTEAELKAHARTLLKKAFDADPTMSEADREASLAAADLDPKSVIDHLLKAKPPAPALIQHDPTKSLVNPQTGAVVTPGVPEPAKPETRGLDVQAAEALAKGDTATYQRLQKVKRDMSRADDDPTLAAVRQLQLQTAQDRAANLPLPVQRRVNQLSDAFRNDPAVTRANVTAEGYSFVKAMDQKTQNPADDQALIYAFAKAMDPDSVVREGEYATVQKYAQSWKDKFGFDVARVLTNSEFLTPAARKNLVDTIGTKFKASRNSYDNVRKGFATQINKTTGQTDANEYLLDYAGAFPVEEAPPAAATSAAPAAKPALGSVVTVNGQKVRVTGFNPDGTLRGVAAP